MIVLIISLNILINFDIMHKIIKLKLNLINLKKLFIKV